MIPFVIMFSTVAIVWLIWEAVTAPHECPGCGNLLYTAGPCPGCGFLCSYDAQPAVKKEP